MLNLVKSGNRMVIVILRDVLMLGCFDVVYAYHHCFAKTRKYKPVSVKPSPPW